MRQKAGGRLRREALHQLLLPAGRVVKMLNMFGMKLLLRSNITCDKFLNSKTLFTLRKNYRVTTLLWYKHSSQIQGEYNNNTGPD